MTPVFFTKIFDRLEFAPNLREFLMTELQSPHRHYHGIGHHGIMLKSLEPRKNRLPLNMWKNAQAACLFHDIVYDPTRSDNEEMSAATAKIWLDSEKFNLPLIEQMILATKSHTLIRIDDHPFRPTSREHMINSFLLADLNILWTTNKARYRWYATGVRKEYAHVPNEAYRIGRAKVLNVLRDSLYSAPVIYCSGDWLNANIDWEIEQLEVGTFDL